MFLAETRSQAIIVVEERIKVGWKSRSFARGGKKRVGRNGEKEGSNEKERKGTRVRGGIYSRVARTAARGSPCFPMISFNWLFDLLGVLICWSDGNEDLVLR